MILFTFIAEKIKYFILIRKLHIFFLEQKIFIFLCRSIHAGLIDLAMLLKYFKAIKVHIYLHGICGWPLNDIPMATIRIKELTKNYIIKCKVMKSSSENLTAFGQEIEYEFEGRARKKQMPLGKTGKFDFIEVQP